MGECSTFKSEQWQYLYLNFLSSYVFKKKIFYKWVSIVVKLLIIYEVE